MKLKKKQVVEKPVNARSDESVTQASQRCGKTNYPPKTSKWGPTIECEDVQAIIDIWKGQGTIDGRSKLLIELLVGLTESQLWEVYSRVKDVGCLKGRNSVHKDRLHRAIIKTRV